MPEPSPSADVVRIAPGDDLPLHAARAATTAAIHSTLAAGGRKLLVDFHGWHGPERPSLALRIDSVFEWADAASTAPGFAMALVMPPQLVDPGRIGFIIGHRLAFNFDVFGSVEEALAWLETAPVPNPPEPAAD
ncbi:hypothetical protein [Cognatilysobacter lacus]|uniref:STAS/SEC14 domain-containing protein n=1 Tax=Cognatilysobacter lacus TaxID=1643323 RepID=A0A5D8ZBL7_9GAMM|nr:hypothetical protein [Lysobacter lacus]TZF91443.1 hypothetical protein FW784_01810 [Lysobacter lacus]